MTVVFKQRLLSVRQTLSAILKEAKVKLITVRTKYREYDDIEGTEYPERTDYRPLKKRELYNGCIDALMDKDGRESPIPSSLEEMINLYTKHHDTQWGTVRVISAKEAKKEQDEIQYQKIEQSAQQFADSCGLKLGTKEFIKALAKAVKRVRSQREHWNNPERRMEEWAAHQFSGGGSETYFDDLNFENGRYEDILFSLEEVWQFLERKFPIMMLRYKESKARRVERKKGETT